MKRILSILLSLAIILAYSVTGTVSAFADEKTVELDAPEWGEIPEPPLQDTKEYPVKGKTGASTYSLEDSGITQDATETEMLLYFSKKIREALLEGKTTVSLEGITLYRNQTEQIHHIGYYCPYTDGEHILVSLYYSTSSGRYTSIGITNSMSLEETRAWVDEVDEKLADLEALVADNSISLADQALILHDYMDSHYHYDTHYTNDYRYSGYYPSVMLTEKRGVCQSYAYLFQYIMNRKGVECYTVSSDAMSHAWNIIRIGSNYYHIDITWDDPINDRFGMAKHSHFLLSDAYIQSMAKPHTGWDLTQYACNDTSYESAYFTVATSPIAFNGTDRYFVDNNGLQKYNVSSKSKTQLDSIGSWSVPDMPGYTYTGKFSGLFSYNGSLYYNSASAIKAYNLGTESTSTYSSIDTEDGSVYGCVDEGDQALYALDYTPGYSDYSSLIIRSVALPARCAGGHTWNGGAVTTAPTCTDAGVKTYTCSVCKKTKTEAVSALGHTAGNAVRENEVAATCTKEGSYDTVTYCTTCGSELSRVKNTVSKKSHTAVKDPAVAATCTETGLTEGSHCSVCGTVLTKQNSISALGHSWNASATIDRAANCTQAGSMSIHCSRCSTVKDETVIPATGHTEVKVAGKAATCTASGLTEGKKCSVCQAVITAQTVIPAKGHTAVTDKGYEATCTEAGLTDGSHCSVCNTVMKKQEVIDPAGHGETVTQRENVKDSTCSKAGSYDEVIYCSICETELSRITKTIAKKAHTVVIDQAMEAYCEEDGLTEGSHCSVCGALIKAQTVIPAKGHSIVTDPAAAATCTKAGVTEGSHCSRCGEVLQAQEVIPATGHTEVKVAGKAVTCTEAGLTEGKKCSVCKEVLVAQTVIPAKGHTAVTDTGYEASCTASGLTEGSHCSVCGTVLTAQEEIPALGHSWNQGVVIKVVTCTEDGIRTFTCSRCHELRIETIEATGHVAGDEVIENATEGICEKGGSYDKVIYCDLCGEELSREHVEQNAPGHIEAVDAEVKPTCTEDGLTEGSHCSVCGEILEAQEVIPAAGHTEVSRTENVKEATCQEEGSYDEVIYCSACEEELARTTVPVEKKEHAAVIDEGTPATCTEEGLSEGSHCSECGEVLEAQETLSALGHKYKTVITKATTSRDGSMVTKCGNCGIVTSKSVISMPKTVTLSYTSTTYSGSAKKPAVTVKDAAGKSIASANYTVAYTGNVKVGKATVTITFKGSRYSGKLTKTFKINPKGTSISSLTKTSKAFTVKWKKQAAQTTGYQIRYSTKSSMSSAKTVTVTKNTTVSKKIKSLKAKKKYYVQVRTYKTLNGTKYYSAWSSKKSVTTK